jgi:hypothetical protein
MRLNGNAFHGLQIARRNKPFILNENIKDRSGQGAFR